MTHVGEKEGYERKKTPVGWCYWITSTSASHTYHLIPVISGKSIFPKGLTGLFENIFMSAPHAVNLKSTEGGSHLLREIRWTGTLMTWHLQPFSRSRERLL